MSVMDLKLVLVTTWLLVKCFVMSMENGNNMGHLDITSTIPGVTESYYQNTVPQARPTESSNTSSRSNITATLPSSTMFPIVTRGNMQPHSNVDQIKSTENAVDIIIDNINTNSDNKLDKIDSSTPVLTTTDVYQNANRQEHAEDKVLNISYTTSDNIIGQQRNQYETTESATTVYKVETKTKLVEEEPNMDRLINLPSLNIDTTGSPNVNTTLSAHIETSPNTGVEQTGVNNTDSVDIQNTDKSDVNITLSPPKDLPLFIRELVRQTISEKNDTGSVMPESSVDAPANNNVILDKKEEEQIVQWLKPNRTEIKPGSVTVNDADIDTRIITTDRLVVVISTICGTFVLFVLILIVVSCCRKKRNVRSDSEKSGASEFSVSTRSIGLYEKQSSTKSRTETKNDYNDMFMGIPTNNAIWKDLDNLPDTASNGIPESTKL